MTCYVGIIDYFFLHQACEKCLEDQSKVSMAIEFHITDPCNQRLMKL